MAKIDRVFSLLAMLSHRRTVTIECITSTLGIPPRTAYRYLNTLSEANIPIVHDRQAGGYRLLRKPELSLAIFSDSELILMATGLMTFRRHLNSPYRKVMDSLYRKFSANQHLQLEKLQFLQSQLPPDHAADPDYSEVLTAAMLEIAISEQRSLSIMRGSDSEADHALLFRNPGLTFKECWRLTGDERLKENELDIRSISMALVSDEGGGARG